jgi:4-diphosphocytidyl-2-C-methyl-D-erythritol kinase
MHLRQRGSDITVHAPAKLNLFFEVLNRRSDGFHEVETLVYPIDLCDNLYLRCRNDQQVKFSVSCVPSPTESDGAVLGDVPADSSNLVVRALELLRTQAGEPFGADVRLVKRIPSAAGLGGGSSDAAAALAAANVAWHLHWPVQRLAAIGAELGSDIPLFFHRGASVCRGRGEIIERAPGWPLLHFVLVRPPEGLATAEVYGACRVAAEQESLDGFLDGFLAADIGQIGKSFFNRLEPAASELSPWIDCVKRAFGSMDCLGSRMTGSGTCYFGLCRHARHARRVARRLRGYGVGKSYAVRGYR